MLKLLKYKGEIQVKNWFKRHTQRDIDDPIYNTLCLYDDDKLVGYVTYRYVSAEVVMIEMIYTIGYGMEVMRRLEKKFKKQGYRIITLDVPIKNNQSQEFVKRRMNFYIKLNYRVSHVVYSPDGVTLEMDKFI